MAGYNFATEEGMRRVIDSVRRLERQVYNRGASGGSKPQSPNEFWCSYKNTSGDTVPGNGVIVLEDIELIASGADRAYEAAKPSTTFGRIFAASQPFGVASNKYGLCKFFGELELLYDDADGTPAFGETWGPKPGQFSLAKGYPGFTVLGVSDSTNHILLAVREEVSTYIGKADAGINKGASGTVSIWIGTPGSESDSTVNISSCYNRTANISSGNWVTVQFINGHPYVAKLEC